MASEHMKRCSVSLAIRDAVARVCPSAFPEGRSLGKQRRTESRREGAKMSYGGRASFQVRRQIRYKDILCSCTKDLDIVEISIRLEVIY